MKKVLTMLILVCCVPAGIFAVGNGESLPGGSLTQVSYSYIDSSVPPRYHRSYTITITESSITVVVDSYGDVLAREIYPAGPDVLKEATARLREHGIRAGIKRRGKRGCTGGNGEAIGWETVQGKQFYATVYHCGGADEGTLYGDVSAFAGWCRSLVPELDKLLDTPYDSRL